MGKDLKGKELGDGLTQRLNGMYCARFTNRFGERISLYNKDIRELKINYENAKYEDRMCLNLVDDKTTLNDWYFKWLTIHKEGIIRDSSRLVYKNVFMKHISPILGTQKISQMTQLQIKKLLNDAKKNGLGFEMRNKIKIVLQDMFDKAIIDSFAKKNPVRGIKLVRDEEKERRVLTVNEQAAFFDCAKGTFYDNLFSVAVQSGLRPGELFALTEKEIDFEKHEINVNKTLLYQQLEGDEHKTFHLHPPKTYCSNRKVPINKTCELALKKQILQKRIICVKSPKPPTIEFGNLLFTTKYGTPLNSQIYSDAIKRIVVEINLTRDALEEMESFSGHCFRHTFATRCFEAGIQPKTVQNYLGHATLQMTMDLYTHLLDEMKHDEMSKLEDSLEQLDGYEDRLYEEKYNQQQRENAKSSNLICWRHGKMA